jgi:hypothetical protein
MIHRHVDRITGRQWFSIWRLHLGFGPDRWLERIHWYGTCIWTNKTALQIHRLKALLYEYQKEARRAGIEL